MYKTYSQQVGVVTHAGDNSDDERDSDRDDERDRDMGDGNDDLERARRFVDVGEESDMFKSKSLNDLKPFYSGASLDERMAEIRKSIYHIRHNWEDFNSFMAALRSLFLEQSEFKNEKVQSLVEKLLTSKRDWLTSEESRDNDVTYDAVKLYTSKEGHDRIYRLSNDIFRRDESISDTNMIRNVVFLVELINIDLFNYCLKCPERTHYEGTVYRGICVTREDLKAFQSLRKEPISRRNIATPLGLFSSSSSVRIARKFIKETLKRRQRGDITLTPLVIKTHVISLKPEYEAHYRKRFPTAILTTICAVDIHRISIHPSEKEVLLRGPFMLVLDMYTDDKEILGHKCHVLETVMLNANRDHISTASLGDQDALARDLFGTMVTVTRSEFAVRYCKDKGLSEDALEYQAILDTSLKKLEDLMRQ